MSEDGVGLNRVSARVFQGIDEASRSVIREEIRFEPEPGLLDIYREWNPLKGEH